MLFDPHAVWSEKRRIPSLVQKSPKQRLLVPRSETGYRGARFPADDGQIVSGKIGLFLCLDSVRLGNHEANGVGNDQFFRLDDWHGTTQNPQCRRIRITCLGLNPANRAENGDTAVHDGHLLFDIYGLRPEVGRFGHRRANGENRTRYFQILRADGRKAIGQTGLDETDGGIENGHASSCGKPGPCRVQEIARDLQHGTFSNPKIPSRGNIRGIVVIAHHGEGTRTVNGKHFAILGAYPLSRNQVLAFEKNVEAFAGPRTARSDETNVASHVIIHLRPVGGRIRKLDVFQKKISRGFPANDVRGPMAHRCKRICVIDPFFVGKRSGR